LPRSRFNLSLQQVSDIHLDTDNMIYIDKRENPGEIKYVYLFSSLALFTLLIACINFVNLTTARSSQRLKEVGMRKVTGANRKDLIKQFLGESIILSAISLLISAIIVVLALPQFNSWAGKSFEILSLLNWKFVFSLLGIGIFTGLISGFYPAFYLSSFRPSVVLKDHAVFGSGNSRLRQGLVVFQFLLSISLIIATLIVNDQLQFLHNADLGFSKDKIIYLPIDPMQNSKYELLKNKLELHSDINEVTRGSMPIESISGTENWQWEGKDSELEVKIHPMLVDYNYISLLDLKIIMGRNFSRKFITDKKSGFIINEKALALLNFGDPIGKEIVLSRVRGKIIGVVEDFHCGSLHTEIGPIIMFINPIGHLNSHKYLAMKINSEMVSNTISNIKNIWDDVLQDSKFEYRFLNETINDFYKKENSLSTLFNYFTLFTIIISMLGLFGLSLFTAERKLKEIGIRKILGASIPNLFFMLSKEFIKLVLIANIVAWPLSYFIMNRWLQNFAYRTEMSIYIFIVSTILTFIITITVISIQIIKAARSNPVKTLKYE